MNESIEHRLAAMEATVANMQRTIDRVTNEADTNGSDLAHSIDRLSDRLDSITIALQNLPAGQTTGRYTPWTEEHEVLLTHKYVAKEVLLNVMWKALRVVDSFFTGWREVNNLLDTMHTYTVSRQKRFPAHGLYINIQHFDVYYKIHQMREFAYRGSAAAHQGGNTAEFKTIVSTLQTLALSNVGSGRTVGMIHDRSSFEEEYNLTWVDKDSQDSTNTMETKSDVVNSVEETTNEDDNAESSGKTEETTVEQSDHSKLEDAVHQV